MSKVILTEEHPTMQKLEKLMNYAEELGLSFDFSTAKQTVMSDVNQVGEDFYITDFESDEPLKEFPYPFNYKVFKEE